MSPILRPHEAARPVSKRRLGKGAEIRELVAGGVEAEAVDQAVEVRAGGIAADQLGESAVPRFIKRAD